MNFCWGMKVKCDSSRNEKRFDCITWLTLERIISNYQRDRSAIPKGNWNYTRSNERDPKGVDTVLHSSLKTFLPRPLQRPPRIRHLNANDQGKNHVAGTWRRGLKQNITQDKTKIHDKNFSWAKKTGDGW